VTIDQLTIAHQLDMRSIPLAYRSELGLFEVGVNPEQVGIDKGNLVLSRPTMTPVP
jgi:hypothetical protein